MTDAQPPTVRSRRSALSSSVRSINSDSSVSVCLPTDFWLLYRLIYQNSIYAKFYCVHTLVRLAFLHNGTIDYFKHDLGLQLLKTL